LFQIWLNLPAKDKLVAPHFTMFWNRSIPRHVARDAHGRTTEITVIAGSIGEAEPLAPPPSSWAASADHDIAIWTIKMEPGARFELPAAAQGSNRRLFFFGGSGLQVASRAVAPRNAIVLRADAQVELENGDAEGELLLLQGRPIGEPVVQHGPFVMNTPEEIRQAMIDYQQTQFGGWPWPSEEPVHGREQGRFARHADGHTEQG
jgi:redox-sensitive bicupin YhaK (pirin superfamily)